MKSRRGFIICLEYFVAFILVIIIGVATFYIVAKPFLVAKRSQMSFGDISEQLTYAHKQYKVGDRRSFPLKLGSEDYLALFTKDAQRVSLISGASADPGAPMYFVPRPTTCPTGKPCFCLCTDASADKEHEEVINHPALDLRLTSTPLLCEDDALFCKQFDFSLEGDCTGTREDTKSSCEGGLLIDRGISPLGEKISATDSIYIEKKDAQTLLLRKFPQ